MSSGEMGKGLEGPNSEIEMRQFIWREMEKVKIREEIMDSVWMQLQQKRIREEVIVDEILRRRLLEADVRRELSLLTIERESALWRAGESAIGLREFPLPCDMEGRPLGQQFVTGMSSVLRPESGGLHTGLRMSAEPHILEGTPQSGYEKQKEKIVLSAKPLQDVNLCARSSACSGKKQLREEWSCALCQVTASCEQGLNVHLQGKRHKAKEAGLRKKGKKFNIGWHTGKTPTVCNKDAPSIGSKLLKKRDEHISKSAKLLSLSQDANDVKGKDCSFDGSGKNNEATDGEMKNSTGNKSYDCKFWWETCQVGVDTLKDMEEHRAGTKHLAQLQKSNQNTQVMLVGHELTVTGKESEKSTSDDSSIVVQKDEHFGQQEKEADTDSETFSVNPEKSGDQLTTISQQLSNSGTPIARKQKNKKYLLRFWCDMCQIGTDTEKVMEIHRTGKKHLECKKLLFRFWCDVCQIGTDTEKVMEIHKTGKKHLSHPRLPEINESPGNETPTVLMQPVTDAEGNSLDTNVCMKKNLLKNRSQFSDVCEKKKEERVWRVKETRKLEKNSDVCTKKKEE